MGSGLLGIFIIVSSCRRDDKASEIAESGVIKLGVIKPGVIKLGVIKLGVIKLGVIKRRVTKLGVFTLYNNIEYKYI